MVGSRITKSHPVVGVTTIQPAVGVAMIQLAVGVPPYGRHLKAFFLNCLLLEVQIPHLATPPCRLVCAATTKLCLLLNNSVIH